MNSLKSALVNAGIHVKKHDASVDPAAASAAAATPVLEPTFTLTETQLTELIASAVARDMGPLAATPAPAGVAMVAKSHQVTNPETCLAYRLLSVLERATSKVIVSTRDRVIVPANIYVVDEARPQALSVVAAGSMIAASGAIKVSRYFSRLAERAATKAASLSVR